MRLPKQLTPRPGFGLRWKLSRIGFKVSSPWKSCTYDMYDQCYSAYVQHDRTDEPEVYCISCKGMLVLGQRCDQTPTSKEKACKIPSAEFTRLGLKLSGAVDRRAQSAARADGCLGAHVGWFSASCSCLRPETRVPADKQIGDTSWGVEILVLVGAF